MLQARPAIQSVHPAAACCLQAYQQQWQQQHAQLQRQLKRCQQLLGNGAHHPDAHGLPALSTERLQAAAEQLLAATAGLERQMALAASELAVSKAAAQQVRPQS